MYSVWATLGTRHHPNNCAFYVLCFFFSLARKRNTSVKNESLVPIQIMIIDWNLVERGDFLARHLLETTASQNHVLLRHNRHANIRRAMGTDEEGCKCADGRYAASFRLSCCAVPS